MYTVYKLRPRNGGAFHFGRRGIELEESGETFPSDSLFAALLATLEDLEGAEAVEGLVRPFAEGNPPFLLSSAFPYAGQVLFLPLPKLHLNVTDGRGRHKQLKNLRYVSIPVFRLILGNEKLDDLLGDENFRQGGRALAAPEEGPGLGDDRLWRIEPVPRVTIDRATSASEIFHVGRTAFAPGGGLYFLVRWREEGQRQRLERLLDHLGDRGLGGERSAGYGQFFWERGDGLELLEAEGSDHFLTLARYHPTFEELKGGVLGEGASYSLTAVGGWLASPEQAAQRRKLLRLIGEGSVLRRVGHGPYGDVPDVRPEYPNEPKRFPHPVYRYGFALPVGVETR